MRFWKKLKKSKIIKCGPAEYNKYGNENPMCLAVMGFSCLVFIVYTAVILCYNQNYFWTLKEGLTMNIITYTANLVRRRPFVMIFLAILSLLYCAVEQLNPLFPIMKALLSAGQGGLIDTYIGLLQLVFGFLTDIRIVALGILSVLGLFLILSAIASALFSGYLHILDNTVAGKPRTKREYIFGFRRYFTRLFVLSLKTMFFSLVFIIFILFSIVPALVVNRTFLSGRADLFLVALLFNIVTIVVLFFVSMFFKSYMNYWIPATLRFRKGAFVASVRVSNQYFWKIIARFFVFDVIFAVFESIIIYGVASIPSTQMIPSILLLLCNWIFKTLFITVFLVYIFVSFQTYYKDLKHETLT